MDALRHPIGRKSGIYLDFLSTFSEVFVEPSSSLGHSSTSSYTSQYEDVPRAGLARSDRTNVCIGRVMTVPFVSQPHTD